MRKLFVLGSFLALAAMSCNSSSDQDSEASDLPILNVSTQLSGANEVPSNSSDATGSVDGTFDPNTGVLDITIMYNDSSTADTNGTEGKKLFEPTAWHIHKAPADSSGGVVFNLGSTFSSPFNFIDTLSTEQMQELKDGLYYVNIHTADHGAGEIRGQLNVAE
jgi:hypothetical protein